MSPSARFDLLRISPVRAALKSRWPQLIVQAIALGGFTLALLAGWLGTPVGNHNVSIVLVWIAWWALLMLIAVPFFGRGWCSVCPIPLPGEWLQRGALLKPEGQGVSLNRRWPNRLRNIWLQNGAFILVALFSAATLTQPRVTALVLSALLVIALGVSLIFERRAFCRYLCPVGGFIGLYAQAAPLELRVKDTALCAAHVEKTCYVGSADGYGCPWQAFPGGLVKNMNCGLCMECLRTCPHDNIALQLRPFGADLTAVSGRKLDEAFKGFIMLGSAIAYSAEMLGPWGALKSAAYAIGSPLWWGYAVAFLALLWALLPGGFFIAVRAGLAWERSRVAPRRTFITLAYALVPFGLMAWVAFSLAFVFASFSYLWPVLSDPLGWGWNLFGTARMEWTPYAMGMAGARWAQTTHVQEIHAQVAEAKGWTPDNLNARVGEPLRLALVSDDVLYGFAVGQVDLPALDLPPGKMVEATLTFARPDKYTYYYTRWCGPNHWRMRGTIEVAGAASAAVADASPLYVTLGLDIDAPHPASVIPAQKPSAAIGQTFIEKMPEGYRTAEYYRSHSPAAIWQSLRNEASLRYRTEADLWDTVAALWQAQTTSAQWTEGRQLYAQNCAACHGEGGAGDGVYAATDFTAMVSDAQSSAANFTDAIQMLGASPALLQGKITRGGMGTGMPYWGSIFTEAQTWALVNYLYSLQFEEQP